MKLTKAQREAMERVAAGASDPWNYAPEISTFLAENKLATYSLSAGLTLTPAGRKALEES